jgi:N-glycosylase/DNA lyase
MAPKGFKTLLLPISQLSLAAVLKCGQSFRWIAYPLAVAGEAKTEDEPTHEYRFALQDRVICLRQDSESLFYRALYPKAKIDESNDADSKRDEETLIWLKDYFQLDVDLVKLYIEWAERDVVFRDTVKDRFAGVRILRQDPWENVIS